MLQRLSFTNVWRPSVPHVKTAALKKGQTDPESVVSASFLGHCWMSTTTTQRGFLFPLKQNNLICFCFVKSLKTERLTSLSLAKNDWKLDWYKADVDSVCEAPVVKLLLPVG